MAEREQPQLLLVSTAHRLATGLMIGRRQVALADLEGGDGDLLIEWSTPADRELDDVDGWRLASPHWTRQRERLIRKRYEGDDRGEGADPEEPDPSSQFPGAVAESVAASAGRAARRVQDLLPGACGRR